MATYKIHTVPRAGHKTHVTNCIQCTEFIEWQALVHEVDGHKFDGAESTVDTTDEFINC